MIAAGHLVLEPKLRVSYAMKWDQSDFGFAS